jgi:hypothetical protein
MHGDEKVEGIVKQKITADFILDIYEKFKKEKNVEKKKEMKLKLELFSKKLNQYLIIPKDFDKYYN